jgi:hypothetical protein
MKRISDVPAVATTVLLAFTIIWTGCSRTATDQASEPAAGEEQAATAPEGTAQPAAPAAQRGSAPVASRPAPSAGAPAQAAPAASQQPVAAPPPPPRPLLVTVPEGTNVEVRTTNTLSTKTVKAGESFAASLSQPLEVDGRVVAPRGATVNGAIVESDPGGRVRGKAFLSVRLTSITLANGQTVDIATSTFGHEAGSNVKKDAVKVGIASGVGAAVGAIAGGGRGAAIGAGAGAAGGTGVVLATRGDAAEIPSESLLTFTLRSPITVEVAR